jgi:hypothetical protein
MSNIHRGIAMLKWRSLGLGAATFLATHAVVVAKWNLWFGGGYGGPQKPWFLNDGNGPVALTAAALCIAATGAAALWAPSRGESVRHGLTVAAGATAAATAVLLSIGPGTIFPIVIVFIAAIALFSSAIGSMIVWPFKSR